MLILTEITDRLQVVLAGNVTANHLQCVASWRDITATTFTPGRSIAVTNNTTDVSLVTSPAGSTQRVIDFLSIYNADTANATVTVKIDINGTDYILFRTLLSVGETIQYTDKEGFYVLASNGGKKLTQVQGQNSAVINTLNTVVLTGDVVNNNATANTIADVVGLSFAVTAGETYWFEFTIPYTSAATTTGSRWAINGPGSPTLLNYTSEYSLTSTSKTVNCLTAYDTPSASNATSLTSGNVAMIWGIITPSGNGTVIARFASEISGSAITAKAGATLRWMRII